METLSSTTETHYYVWNGYRCAYDWLRPSSGNSNQNAVPLLLIHPIGVGLSRQFWQRFCTEWYRSGQQNEIYNPDLLGCGESDMPHIAYRPIDWAKQLQYFLQTIIKKPVVLVVQGALLPVAVELMHLQPNLIQGLVLSGPPAWVLVTQATPDWRHRLAWNLFDSPLGSGFYRYARRSQFLKSFSTRQLFAKAEEVDAEWLDMLQKGAKAAASRHAVFSFLSGFWRQDYRSKMAQIQQPTLVVMGEQASSISREGKQETPDDKIADYLACFPNAQGIKIAKRNVLPYEATPDFVSAVASYLSR